MIEEIEVKRKIFTVVESLGDRSKKVERNGKLYFYKDFDKDVDGFESYVSSFNDLKTSGIPTPKIYVYDKNKMTVVTEFVEGTTVLEDLMKEDLSEAYYQQIFLINWYCKRNKFLVDFDPKCYKLVNDKMIYIGMYTKPYDIKGSFEKNAIFFWFYTEDFVKYLIKNYLPVDRARANQHQGYLKKQIALMTIQHYR